MGWWSHQYLSFIKCTTLKLQSVCLPAGRCSWTTVFSNQLWPGRRVAWIDSWLHLPMISKAQMMHLFCATLRLGFAFFFLTPQWFREKRRWVKHFITSQSQSQVIIHHKVWITSYRAISQGSSSPYQLLQSDAQQQGFSPSSLQITVMKWRLDPTGTGK